MIVKKGGKPSHRSAMLNVSVKLNMQKVEQTTMNQQKVGSFLKELRTEKALTQTALAELLGVSNRSISRWENGMTMPDLDLLIELANYYDVEVGEILEGERKTNCMEKETEKLMLNIADYSNEEKRFFSRRMCIMFTISLIGIVVYAVIDLMGLSLVQPYESIITVALGFVTGTLLTGVLYTSRYGAKIRAAKVRLLKKLRNLKG